MKEDRPKPPLAGLIYGEIVYWGVLAGSLIVIVGSVLAFLGDNFVPVSYWVSSIWKGETVYQTWKGATGALPNGHWYLSHLTTGDGLSALGISLGVFSVVPALFLSAAALFKEKEWLYGALAMVGGIVVVIGVLGLAPMPK
jgi:hypothetical protein